MYGGELILGHGLEGLSHSKAGSLLEDPTALCGVIGWTYDITFWVCILSQNIILISIHSHSFWPFPHFIISIFRVIPLNWTVGIVGIPADTTEDALIVLAHTITNLVV